MSQDSSPAKSHRIWSRWWVWAIIVFALLMIPIPRPDEGSWPTLFVFFDWINSFLPENF